MKGKYRPKRNPTEEKATETNRKQKKTKRDIKVRRRQT